MRSVVLAAAIAACLGAGFSMRAAYAAHPAAEICPRPAVGASVDETQDLRSVAGVLKVDLAIHNERSADGTDRYCYLTPDGHQSPTLRVHPGDLVILRLSNHLTALDGDATSSAHRHAATPMSQDPCERGAMLAT